MLFGRFLQCNVAKPQASIEPMLIISQDQKELETSSHQTLCLPGFVHVNMLLLLLFVEEFLVFRTLTRVRMSLERVA